MIQKTFWTLVFLVLKYKYLIKQCVETIYIRKFELYVFQILSVKNWFLEAFMVVFNKVGEKPSLGKMCTNFKI